MLRKNRLIVFLLSFEEKNPCFATRSVTSFLCALRYKEVSFRVIPRATRNIGHIASRKRDRPSFLALTSTSFPPLPDKIPAPRKPLFAL